MHSSQSHSRCMYIHYIALKAVCLGISLDPSVPPAPPIAADLKAIVKDSLGELLQEDPSLFHPTASNQKRGDPCDR